MQSEVNSTECVLYSIHDSVFEITINRPEKLNALNLEVYKNLGLALNRFAKSTARICVLRGARGKAFVAGADIDQYVGMNGVEFRSFIDFGFRVMRQMMEIPKPIIAAVNGYALGGGLELAMHCDLIVASTSSKLGLPEALLGLLPGGGGTQLLPRLIGRMRANDLIMRGRFIGAQEAFDCGLISAIFSETTFEEELQTYIAQLLKHSPLAQGMLKKLIYAGLELPLIQAMTLESEMTSELINTEDAREGIQAFVEKRKPKFKGL
jgi:enoyl-CoA hydratase/carnithine racemase